MWCIGLGLLANAAVLLWTRSPSSFPDISLDTKAYAQLAATPADRLLGARGMFMMPAQLGPNTWGLYLMDVDSQTICVYRALPESSRFRLMAARSFKSDRFLEDFNNDEPTPREIQKEVEQQRQRQQLEGKKEETPP